MTILRLTRQLKTYLEATFPATQTFTVTSVSGTQLTVNTSTGTTGQWAGGLLTVTSGDLINETVAVSNNVTTTIHLGTAFTADDAAELVGSTITLTGGPLADATVFHIQPHSVKDLVSAGHKDFVFINPLNYSIATRSIGQSGPSKNARNQVRTYGIQLMCQVPFATGGTTVADAYAKQTRIYNLAEQVIARCHSFKHELKFPIFEDEALDVSFGLIDREGAEPAEVAVIEMGFTLAR